MVKNEDHGESNVIVNSLEWVIEFNETVRHFLILLNRLFPKNSEKKTNKRRKVTKFYAKLGRMLSS